MPCYDARDSEPEVVYKNGVSPDLLYAEQQKTLKLEAVLCAVFNEIKRRGILEDVISEASRNGLIDVMSFYEKHRNDDIAKIASDLHKRYSKDELAIVKQLLNNAKL